MKKILILVSLILFCTSAHAQDNAVQTYSEENKFGLIKNEQKITEAKYNKLIRLKDSSWLFLYKNKFGIMDNDGNILVEPKFTQAQRYVGRFAKLGSKGLYCLFDENANLIIPQEYSAIEILYGKMFLVEKNYKYGLISFNGDIILAPIADDIYMPRPNILKISYDGVWHEIEQKSRDTIELPKDISEISQDSENFTVKQIIDQPITSAGYGVVSASDYLIKVFSSISPAYEQTIDELILNHGADTATILMKSSWLVKFPFVYGKNYFKNLTAPNNGPLADVKANLKNKMSN